MRNAGHYPMRPFLNFDSALKICLIICMVGAIGRGAHASAAGADHDVLRIGLSLQPSNALVMIALDQGYFAEEGLQATVDKFVSGKRALQDGLFAGKVDLVTASDVPIVLSRFRRQDFSVIATIFRVDNQNRIVARADRGIRRPADLRGRRVATQRASAVHFFLHLFLLENEISEQELRLSFRKAGELPAALARGDIDAFSMREPYIGQAKEQLGERAIVFAAPGLYSQTDEVVLANDFLKDKPHVAKKILRALVKAEGFAAQYTGRSQEIVAKFLGTSVAKIAAIWPEFVPLVSLEQGLLLRLEDIARWAIRRQLVERRTIPNFLRLIHFEALQAVKPFAITVVR